MAILLNFILHFVEVTSLPCFIIIEKILQSFHSILGSLRALCSMPEENDNVTSSLLNDSDEDESEKVEDQTGRFKKSDPPRFKLCGVMQKCFSRQKTSINATVAEENSKVNSSLLNDSDEDETEIIEDQTEHLKKSDPPRFKLREVMQKIFSRKKISINAAEAGENSKVNNSLLNDSVENKKVKIVDQTEHSKKSDPSQLQEIMQNFFNSQKTSRSAADAEENSKQGSYLRQLSKALCERVGEMAYKNIDEDGSSNDEGPVSHKNNKNDEIARRYLRRKGKYVEIKPLANEERLDELNCQGSVNSKTSKFNFLKMGGKKATKIIHEDGTNSSSSYDAEASSLNVSAENSKDASELAREQLKRSDGVFSGSGYDNTRESRRQQKDEPMPGISGNLLQRSFSTDNDKNPKTKSQSKMKIFKFSFGNLVLPRLYSGSAILKNKGDTNMQFTKLKYDSEPIVDTTTTFRSMSQPSLLSGGQVILEGFSDSFKPLTFDADDPIIHDELPEGVTAPQLSTFKPSSPTPRAARLSSGGSMTDVSSKCISLPELFPSKKSFLDDARPSILRHLSGGEMVVSPESETEVSVNPSSKRLFFKNLVSVKDSSHYSIDFSSLKQVKAKCANCLSTNPFASTSSQLNSDPMRASCSCSHTSEDNSSARASSEYVEEDIEIRVEPCEHEAEASTEDESLSEADFSSSTMPRSFSQYSVNQEIIENSNEPSRRNEIIRNEDASPLLPPLLPPKVSKFRKGRPRYL